jgi:hypothetical protein
LDSLEFFAIDVCVNKLIVLIQILQQEVRISAISALHEGSGGLSGHDVDMFVEMLNLSLLSRVTPTNLADLDSSI